MNDQIHEHVQRAADAAGEKSATEFVALDVSGLNPFTDAVLIVSGASERNVLAIADGIEEALLLSGAKPLRREGKTEGRWVLLDFGDLIVHVMHPEERVYYGLERLWREAPVITLTQNSHV